MGILGVVTPGSAPLGNGGRKPERVGLTGFVVAPLDRGRRFCLDLFYKAGGDQLICDLERCGALQFRRDDKAVVFALR